MTDIAHELPPAADRLAELAPLFDELAAVATRGEVPGPDLLARVVAARSTLSHLAHDTNDTDPYSRSILRVDDQVEIMLARWRPGHSCAPHDHGGSGGYVVAVEGTFRERRFDWGGPNLVVTQGVTRHDGDPIQISPQDIHDMAAETGGMTLHLYSPPAESMRVFDVERREVLELVGNYGAGYHPATTHASPSLTSPPKSKIGR